MKRFITSLAIACTVLCASSSCEDFLDVKLSGVIDGDYAMSHPEEMCIAAYSALGDDYWDCPLNLWPYGDVRSDDAYKGGMNESDNQGYHDMEVCTSLLSTTGNIDGMWYRLYCVISRVNQAIIAVQNADEATYPQKAARLPEMRFLRAHFYFKLKTVFRYVPYIDEVAHAEQTQEQVGNRDLTEEEFWNRITEDFEAAYNTLDMYPADKARVSKTAAAAYLAKVWLYRAFPQDENHQFTGTVDQQALRHVITYTDYVKSATEYRLEPDFSDNFLPENPNGCESIFAVQHSTKTADGTIYGRANWSNILNCPAVLFPGGHDFLKPSQNLVNAFKTRNGLPMFDDFNDSRWIPNPDPSVQTQKVDPRLFHTVAMRGFPYKYDKEIIFTYANSRTPGCYGWYSSMKQCCPVGSPYVTYDEPWQAFGMNEIVLRYADIMLIRAEALIELNENLEEARTLINEIRTRAKNSMARIDYAEDFCEISTYPESGWTQEYARQAVRFERRLELAMEHQRFFDLVRWGTAADVLNEFYRTEYWENPEPGDFRDDAGNDTYYDGGGYVSYYQTAHFEKGTHEYIPIPFPQMNYVPGLYTQNPHYN